MKRVIQDERSIVAHAAYDLGYTYPQAHLFQAAITLGQNSTRTDICAVFARTYTASALVGTRCSNPNFADCQVLTKPLLQHH
jgi:hypothetical protein